MARFGIMLPVSLVAAGILLLVNTNIVQGQDAGFFCNIKKPSEELKYRIKAAYCDEYGIYAAEARTYLKMRKIHNRVNAIHREFNLVNNIVRPVELEGPLVLIQYAIDTIREILKSVYPSGWFSLLKDYLKVMCEFEKSDEEDVPDFLTQTYRHLVKTKNYHTKNPLSRLFNTDPEIPTVQKIMGKLRHIIVSIGLLGMQLKQLPLTPAKVIGRVLYGFAKMFSKLIRKSNDTMEKFCEKSMAHKLEKVLSKLSYLNNFMRYSLAFSFVSIEAHCFTLNEQFEKLEFHNDLDGNRRRLQSLEDDDFNDDDIDEYIDWYDNLFVEATNEGDDSHLETASESIEQEFLPTYDFIDGFGKAIQDVFDGFRDFVNGSVIPDILSFIMVDISRPFIQILGDSQKAIRTLDQVLKIPRDILKYVPKKPPEPFGTLLKLTDFCQVLPCNVVFSFVEDVLTGILDEFPIYNLLDLDFDKFLVDWEEIVPELEGVVNISTFATLPDSIHFNFLDIDMGLVGLIEGFRDAFSNFNRYTIPAYGNQFMNDERRSLRGLAGGSTCTDLAAAGIKRAVPGGTIVPGIDNGDNEILFNPIPIDCAPGSFAIMTKATFSRYRCTTSLTGPLRFPCGNENSCNITVGNQVTQRMLICGSDTAWPTGSFESVLDVRPTALSVSYICWDENVEYEIAPELTSTGSTVRLHTSSAVTFWKDPPNDVPEACQEDFTRCRTVTDFSVNRESRAFNRVGLENPPTSYQQYQRFMRERAWVKSFEYGVASCTSDPRRPRWPTIVMNMEKQVFDPCLMDNFGTQTYVKPFFPSGEDLFNVQNMCGWKMLFESGKAFEGALVEHDVTGSRLSEKTATFVDGEGVTPVEWSIREGGELTKYTFTFEDFISRFERCEVDLSRSLAAPDDTVLPKFGIPRLKWLGPLNYPPPSWEPYEKSNKCNPVSSSSPLCCLSRTEKTNFEIFVDSGNKTSFISSKCDLSSYPFHDATPSLVLPTSDDLVYIWASNECVQRLYYHRQKMYNKAKEFENKHGSLNGLAMDGKYLPEYDNPFPSYHAAANQYDSDCKMKLADCVSQGDNCDPIEYITDATTECHAHSIDYACIMSPTEEDFFRVYMFDYDLYNGSPAPKMTCDAGRLIQIERALYGLGLEYKDLGDEVVRNMTCGGSECTFTPSITSKSEYPGNSWIIDYSCLCDGPYYLLPTSEGVCLPCVAGTFRNSSMFECDDCPPGSYSGEGATRCIECDYGDYQGNSSSTFCKKCSAGEYTDLKGQTECVLCPPGTFISYESAHGCAIPAPGYFTDEEGATSASPCPPGTYRGPSDSSLRCKEVSPGYYTNEPAAAVPIPCQEGSFSVQWGSTQCISCAIGSYQDELGQTKCKSCSSDNLTTVSVGSNSSDNCVPIEEWDLIDIIIEGDENANMTKCANLIAKYSPPGTFNETEDLDELGNGFCNKGPWNTRVCGFDKGDCCLASCIRNYRIGVIDGPAEELNDFKFEVANRNLNYSKLIAFANTSEDDLKEEFAIDTEEAIGSVPALATSCEDFQCLDPEYRDCAAADCIDRTPKGTDAFDALVHKRNTFKQLLDDRRGQVYGDDELIGDGICHTEYNNETYGYDGGDCCWWSCVKNPDYDFSCLLALINDTCLDPIVSQVQDGASRADFVWMTDFEPPVFADWLGTTRSIECSEFESTFVDTTTPPDDIQTIAGDNDDCFQSTKTVEYSGSAEFSIDSLPETVDDTCVVHTFDIWYNVIDFAGNSARRDIKIQVVDTTPPELTCTNEIWKFECSSPGGVIPSQDAALFDIELPTGVDTCYTRDNSVTIELQEDFFPLGTSTATFVASDPCGNERTCQIGVEVHDKAPPIPTCPDDIEIDQDGSDGVSVSFDDIPRAIDVCDNDLPLPVMSHESGDYFPVGQTVVTATFTDESGNAASCQFNVVVFDFPSSEPSSTPSLSPSDVPSSIPSSQPSMMPSEPVTMELDLEQMGAIENLEADDVFWVVILSSSLHDVTVIDYSSLRCGVTGVEATPLEAEPCFHEDYDGDETIVWQVAFRAGELGLPLDDNAFADGTLNESIDIIVTGLTYEYGQFYASEAMPMHAVKKGKDKAGAKKKKSKCKLSKGIRRG